MTLARRLSAATMTLVLALFPVAMERCRTACLASGGQTPQAAAPAHSCHDASDEGNGARMDPMARACGHSDEARTHESVSQAAGNDRTVPLAAVQPLAGDVPLLHAVPAGWVPARSLLPRIVLSLALPLRL